MSSPVEKIFEDAGAIMHGHFVLTSGRHSPVYWEKFRVIEEPVATVKLCRMIADHYRNQGVDVVAGPTTGGIILAHEIARQLGVRSAFAEKVGNSRAFRRGVAIQPEDSLLIVDDILTTGTSLKDVIDAVKTVGAKVVGIAVLVDRSDNGVELGFPLFSCLRSPAVSYAPDACPLCKEHRPLTKLGGI